MGAQGTSMSNGPGMQPLEVGAPDNSDKFCTAPQQHTPQQPQQLRNGNLDLPKPKLRGQVTTTPRLISACCSIHPPCCPSLLPRLTSERTKQRCL